jgi:FixJ family two-component response regulator
LIADGHCKPIIFMTALSAEEARTRAMDIEVFGFLRKPFSDERLIDCLDRALKGVHAKSLQP